MEGITYNFASQEDYSAIRDLLRENDLPHSDIDHHIQHFILAKYSGTLVGAIALEDLKEFALLRSLVVDSRYRNRGIASGLYERITEYAKRMGITEMYLLTTTASGYFEKLGYETTSRDAVPEPVQKTLEFSSLCPSSAVCMYKRIN